jgi:hypothetical protein
MNPSKNLILLIFVLIFCNSCSLSNKAIRDKSWNYVDGYSVGNFIIFHKKIQISNDTIYRNGQILALIIDSKYRALTNDDMLVISDPKRERIGQYITK